jgi:hypothetical protein
MDTQRLILFVVFSASALMLWEAWQKEYRPPPPVVASTPAKPSAATDLPPTPAVPSATPSAPSALPGGAVAARVEKEPAAAGRTISIVTDLYRAEVDTTGGAITQVALLKYHDPGDEAKPYLALLRTPERTFVAQSGLLGPGMPNHRTVYTPEPGPRELAPGADRIDPALAGGGTERRSHRAGADVPSRHLRDRRRLRRHECRHGADRAVRVLPVHPRFEDPGLAEFDGAGVLSWPGHLQRERQVQEDRIQRARQGSGRPYAASSRTPRIRTTAGSRWSSITSSPPGFPADDKKTAREFYARKLEGGLYAAG